MKTFANNLRAGTFFLLACLLLPASRARGRADHSYVRGAAEAAQLKGGTQGVAVKVAVIDTTLAATLKQPGYATVDVLMQQCFAGGFLKNLKADPPAADWTFCSAAKTDECSWYLAGIVPPNTEGISDNFSRAWRDDALVKPATGMKQHYLTAKNGKGNIPKDRFAAPGEPINFMVVPIPITYVVPVVQIINGRAVTQWVPQVNIVPAYYPVVDGALSGKKGLWVYYVPPGKAAGDWFEVTPVPAPPAAPTSWKVVTTGATFANFAQSAKAVEHPVYDSAGAGSDARTLNPDSTNVQQYAILVQWDVPEFKGTPTADFGACISRMYNLLTGAYKVSADNIAVLYFTGLYADGNASLPKYTLTPGPMGDKSETLDAVPTINAPSGSDGKKPPKQEFADYAVPGNLFKNAVTNFDTANLFVYFTGHGCRSDKNVKVGFGDPNLVLKLLPDSVTNDDGTVTQAGFDAIGEFEQALVSFLASTNSSDLSSDAAVLADTNNVLDAFHDPVDLLQISTLQPIPEGVQLIINGYTNLTPLQPVTNSDVPVFDLDPIVPGLLTNTYTYQVPVNNMLLYNATTDGTTPAPIELQFQGLPNTSFDPNFVAAVIVRGAAQEVAYTPPNFTAGATQLTAQEFGCGILLTWPPGATNYNILQTSDLASTNWSKLCIPNTTNAEVTGIPDPTLPLGATWAFISYTTSQMFFRLQPVP
ncbi:MAG TPA: hypothetical protein VN578_24590 [Candidatus Binatia bacterium]|jgi:hypothetical protein|nr:hypothetical protein [Candidatus Binatia bacterium]